MNIFILLFLIWRSILFIAANLGQFFILPKNNFLGRGFDSWQHAPLLWHWANFDGEHYLSIASYGYKQFEYAFFPGFPGLIKLFNLLIHNVLLSGFLISNISALVLMLLLFKLFSLDFKKDTVIAGLVIFLCFPTAFFLGTVYSESLFLVLAVGSFLSARKNLFLLAACLVIFACFTRLVGIFLLPTILIIWWKQSRKVLNLIPLLFIPIGLLLVMFLNYIYTNDTLNFFHVQSSFGANRSSNLILLPQVFFRYIKIFVSANPLSLNYFVAVQEFLLTIISFILLIVSFKRMKFEYWIFCLGVILTPTLTGTLSSMPRYILAAFPLFFWFGELIKNKYFFASLALGLFIIELINLVLFTSGYFVA